MSNATLLLIPGILNTPAVFDGLRARWQGAAALRVLDVRAQDSLAAMAHDGWRLLADLPPHEPRAPLVIAGFSMGGYVLLQMLADAPRPVHGAGLICTSARADTPEATAQRERAIAAMERDFDRYAQSLTDFLLLRRDPALRQTVAADMRNVGAAAGIRQNRLVAVRADRRDLVRSLPMPVQVLGGTADPVTPPDRSQEIAALAPDAQLQLIDGAGHMLPFEHPQTLADALGTLVERALLFATTTGDRSP